MDDSSKLMLMDAYDETVRDAIAAGHSSDIAHKEGITAAAMFLSSMTGLEDNAARNQVEGLGLKPH